CWVKFFTAPCLIGQVFPTGLLCMSQPNETRRMVIQSLRWGRYAIERPSPSDTQYTVTGRRIYATGDIDGRFRPRSNPYDLHAFGRPRPDDPLAEKLQGVWAQPVKGFGGYRYVVEIDGDPWPLDDAERFTQGFASVSFAYHRAPLSALREDAAAVDL